MKILNLRFKNINSLKGEWEIAFDRYPLADAARAHTDLESRKTTGSTLLLP